MHLKDKLRIQGLNEISDEDYNYWPETRCINSVDQRGCCPAQGKPISQKSRKVIENRGYGIPTFSLSIHYINGILTITDRFIFLKKGGLLSLI